MDTDPTTTTESETPERLTEFDFFLTGKPIPYTHGREAGLEGTFIRLFAPSSKVSKECAALKQAFARAMNEQQARRASLSPEQLEAAKVRQEKDDSDPDGEEVILMLAASDSVDLADVLEVGRRLFLSPGIAKIDGEGKLTGHILDQIDQPDFERMVGDYMVGFTLASLFLKMKDV